jgi:hypothetical protein
MQLLPANGTSFPASPVVAGWARYSTVFTVPGLYSYADANAPTRVGTIIVR